MLPGGGTNDVSILEAYRAAFKRFNDLEDLKRRADRLFEMNSTKARVKFREMLRRTIGVSFDNLATEGIDRQAIVNSLDFMVERIKTINSEHFEKFKQTIEQGLLERKPVVALRDLVKSAAGVGYPKWMVDRVVVDQYLTSHAIIQQNRQRSAGISHYFWRTSRDARVRPSDAALDGMRFSWDAPPEGGHPGEKVRCRCTADPDLSSTGINLYSAF